MNKEEIKGTIFQEKVYAITSKIPKGKVATYKIVANKVGVNSCQAVGQALKRNPRAPIVPCHRVVASDGTMCGFAGHRTGKKIDEKIKILKSEGISVKEGKIVNFEQVLWD